MKKVTAPAMMVLSKVVRTTLEDLMKNIEDFPKEIVQEAVNAGLHPSGPQYWIYKWETCVTLEEFELKICLPVATFGNSFSSEKFKLEKLEEYVHVKKTHLGAWDQLKESYEVLMKEMEEAKLVPGQTCREIYINCDFENPSNNITEIQFQVN
ncbi:GyrI-like domain-containing protein [Marinifilum sp. D714]|uniref:GyrI-like domain-containing protein n=1 Tax=Marinifilum sp. D714 TaxID=2937523 RepID=UPI0027C4E04F|nr:GyrI-like domain-containing protein [Marinifilum sp. D714]MDQ2177864.1 GyrI-like domain-containing protein [Marinifilum sp. D714]